jgi:hypothetical protein
MLIPLIYHKQMRIKLGIPISPKTSYFLQNYTLMMSLYMKNLIMMLLGILFASSFAFNIKIPTFATRLSSTSPQNQPSTPFSSLTELYVVSRRDVIGAGLTLGLVGNGIGGNVQNANAER